MTSNGIRAAQLFCQIESMTSFEPFTWLFIRPPWSINGACCKECVFVYMKNYLQDVRIVKIYQRERKRNQMSSTPRNVKKIGNLTFLFYFSLTIKIQRMFMFVWPKLCCCWMMKRKCPNPMCSLTMLVSLALGLLRSCYGRNSTKIVW